MNTIRNNFRPGIVVLILLSLTVCGCGYSTRSRTAKGIKSVAVPFFENQTSEPALEITFTERVIQNLIDDNTLKVREEEYADAILRGQITQFLNQPFSFNADLNAEEYHVNITVRASLINRELGEPIWENLPFSGEGTYFLDTTDNGNTFEDAMEEAIREITDRILDQTTQAW